MGFVLTILKVGLKAVDVGFAGAEVVDRTITKVKAWKRKRRLVKAIQKKAQQR